MEAFVRVAMTKYYKTGLCKTITDAVETMFIDHLLPYFQTFDCHRWRTEHLWNEECDLVYKRLLKAFKRVYEKNTGRYALPGAPKYMSTNEFFDLICACDVVDEEFG